MATPSDPLERLRLSKNAYFFNLRRRFAPVGHYMVKKSRSLNPLVRMFGGTPKPKLPSRPAARVRRHEEEDARSSGPSFLSAILKTMAVFFVLALLAGIGVWWWISANAPQPDLTPPPPRTGFLGGLEVRPLILDFLTAGPRTDPKAQAYVQFDYTARNLSNVWVDARLYASPPARQVFLLSHPRIGDRDWAAFRSSLEENLRLRGWPLSEVRIEDLRGLPGGSTLIIPTGLMPRALLDTSPDVPDLSALAARGVSVIYIGQPFGLRPRDALGPSGTPSDAPDGVLNRLGFTFNTVSRPPSQAPFRMSATLYGLVSKQTSVSTYYGSVSGLSIGRGFLLFVPQTLEGGWPAGGAQAGEDIALLAAEEPYRTSLALTGWASSSPLPDTGRVSLFFEPPGEARAGIIRLRFYLNDTAGSIEQLVVDWPIAKASTGDLFMDGGNVLVPKYLGGADKSIDLQPNDPSGRQTNLYLELEQDSRSIDRAPVGVGPSYTNLQATAYYSTDAPTGSYVLRLVDNYNHVYAASRVWVPNLDVVGPASGYFTNQKYGERAAFGRGEFLFAFFSDGALRAVPEVNVSMAGPTPSMNGPMQTFSSQDTIDYKFKRDFTRGNYTFTFDFGRNYKRNVTLSYWYRLQVWERQDVLLLGGLAAVIFSIGFYVSKLRTDKPLFSLDIPDFPPQSVLKVRVGTAQVLGLFEQLNRDYAWERMPLKAEELRNGFRKIISGGKPVMIGDYNLARILGVMSERRLVAEELGYWMPVSWLREGVPARRLAMYRSLRDLFVTYAIRFSRLRALPNCDVKFIIGQAEYFLHIYEGSGDVILRALGTTEAGSTWILFKDADERERFEEGLHSAAQAPLALKLQIANRRIRLVTLDELPSLLKSIK